MDDINHGHWLNIANESRHSHTDDVQATFTRIFDPRDYTEPRGRMLSALRNEDLGLGLVHVLGVLTYGHKLVTVAAVPLNQLGDSKGAVM
jgi:hypothetical protein